MRHTYLIIYLSLLLSACGANISDDNASNPLSSKQSIAPLSLNYSEMGKQYMQRNQYDFALVRLQKAIEIDDNNTDAYHTLAILYERLQQPEKALKAYQAALELNAHDSSLQNNYGRFLCQQGRGAEAQQHFRNALENPLYKTPEVVHANAGVCAILQNQPQQAETHFRRAISVENPHSNAATQQAIHTSLYQLALLYYQRGEAEEALNFIKRHLSWARQQSPEALLLGVKIAQLANDKNREAAYAHLLRSKFPDSPELQELRNIR